jgi:hypothetical protein
MQRIHVTLVRSLAALLVACGATAPSLAAVCNNVSFSMINTSDGPIKILKVRYRDLDSSDTSKRWEQNVTDRECPAGWECTTSEEDLGSITRPRENHELTDIQFSHQHQDIFGNWKAAIWSAADVPDTMTCTDNRNYGPYEVN